MSEDDNVIQDCIDKFNQFSLEFLNGMGTIYKERSAPMKWIESKRKELEEAMGGKIAGNVPILDFLKDLNEPFYVKNDKGEQVQIDVGDDIIGCVMPLEKLAMIQELPKEEQAVHTVGVLMQITRPPKTDYKEVFNLLKFSEQVIDPKSKIKLTKDYMKFDLDTRQWIARVLAYLVSLARSYESMGGDKTLQAAFAKTGRSVADALKKLAKTDDLTMPE